MIAIGGEGRTDAFYPSETIAQMALWTVRKQKSDFLPIVISLNLAPALHINGIPKKAFYPELEQKGRILENMRLF